MAPTGCLEFPAFTRAGAARSYCVAAWFGTRGPDKLKAIKRLMIVKGAAKERNSRRIKESRNSSSSRSKARRRPYMARAIKQTVIFDVTATANLTGSREGSRGRRRREKTAENSSGARRASTSGDSFRVGRLVERLLVEN